MIFIYIFRGGAKVLRGGAENFRRGAKSSQGRCAPPPKIRPWTIISIVKKTTKTKGHYKEKQRALLKDCPNYSWIVPTLVSTKCIEKTELWNSNWLRAVVLFWHFWMLRINDAQKRKVLYIWELYDVIINFQSVQVLVFLRMQSTQSELSNYYHWLIWISKCLLFYIPCIFSNIQGD